MSDKKYIITITDDQILRKKIRGSEPLRSTRIHKDRREKRQSDRIRREMQDW